MEHDVSSQVERDALVERIMGSLISTFDLFAVYLGDRLGYYQTLAAGDPVTSADLAAQTGTDERYAREWLEQQAVTGLLQTDEQQDSALRRYHLPAGHAEVLVPSGSVNYLAPYVRIVLGSGFALPAVLEAFQTGGGVAYADYGADLREGLADGNRPQFDTYLGSTWFPAIPTVHARLLEAPPARVLDVGCGVGWSSLAIARAYPHVLVHGVDLDQASILTARANAEAAGLADRVRFTAENASDAAGDDRYDLACAFECIHDMSDPVGALRMMRRRVGQHGSVLIVDERAPDAFAAPGDDLDRFLYGISVAHCLPVSMAEHPSAATGTVMRTATLRRYAFEAGYRDLTVLPIENDFWRFYHLLP